MLVDHSKTGNYSYTAVGSVSNRTGIYPVSQVRLEMDLYQDLLWDLYRSHYPLAVLVDYSKTDNYFSAVGSVSQPNRYLSTLAGAVGNGSLSHSLISRLIAPTEQCEKWISIAPTDLCENMNGIDYNTQII